MRRNPRQETDLERQTAEQWYLDHPDIVAKTVIPFTNVRPFFEDRSAEVPKNTGKHFARAVIEPEVVITPLSLRKSRIKYGSRNWFKQERALRRLEVGKVYRKKGHGIKPGYARASWMRADPCAYCGGVADTFDHLEPRKWGGDHSEGNLARACHSCNHEKSSRSLLMFLAIRAQRKAAGTWRRLPPLRLRKS